MFMTDCQVYLIPGFFGFQSFGSYNYFNGIKEIVQNRLDYGHGIKAKVIDCRTKPTASLTSRAKATIDEVVSTEGHKAKALHFIGHSTGGLDARLLLTPGVKLRSDEYESDIVKRTKSLTTVSTPHYGTPIAGFFTSFQGKHILNMLTALASSKGGRQGIYWGAQAAGLVSKLDNYFGLKNTILDELGENFFSKISLKKDDPLWEYLKKVQEDQGALIQLTPEGMDLFNAAVVDAPNIQYRSVVTSARRPPLKKIFSHWNVPTLAGSMGLYFVLREICARHSRVYPYPRPSEEELSLLKEELGISISEKTNDGISPCLSQVHGELITATHADHLDIVGQFARAKEEAKYSDWMASSSGFGEQEFQRVWERVADGIASANKTKD